VSPPTQRAGPPPREPGPKISRHQATDPGQPNPAAVPAQWRRRRAESWRCPPLADGRRDPWTDQHPDDWSDTEITGSAASAAHLRALNLYGSWQVPASVRQAWRRRCRWQEAA
jgi:hypothetical protein